jgi:hypothetical protein
MPKNLYKNQFLGMTKEKQKQYAYYINKQLNNDLLFDTILDVIENAKDINVKDSRSYLLNDVAIALEDLQDNHSVEKAVNTLFQNSELIGDLILSKVIDDIIDDLMKEKIYTLRKYNSCMFGLKNLMNMNIFLKELMDKIKFEIHSYFPDILKLPIRISKRDIHMYEILSVDCIDYKYTSNFYEQLIFLTFFLLGGFEQVKQSFLNQITNIGFDPKTYVDYCFEKKVYPHFKFKSGCSCKNKITNERLCDNPRRIDETFMFVESLSCPAECGHVEKSKSQKSLSELNNNPKEEIEDSKTRSKF